MTRIKAVLFDADGVIVYPQMQFSRHLETHYGITRQMTAGFFHGAFDACLTGEADLKDVLPPFLHQWGWQDTVDEFVRTWLAVDDVVDRRIVDKIHSLRKGGLVCCLATSQEHYRAEYMRTRMGFGELFDRLFFSCEIGWQKPAPGFYQHIEVVLGLPGEELFFWDDLTGNVEAARQRGWKAEVYTSFDELERYVYE